MLTVDGYHLGIRCAGGFGYEFATGDQYLFVCKADALAEADGFIGGGQAGHSYDGGHHESGIGMGGSGHQRFRPDFEAGPKPAVDAHFREHFYETATDLICRYHYKLGKELDNLPGE